MSSAVHQYVGIHINKVHWAPDLRSCLQLWKAKKLALLFLVLTSQSQWGSTRAKCIRRYQSYEIYHVSCKLLGGSGKEYFLEDEMSAAVETVKCKFQSNVYLWNESFFAPVKVLNTSTLENIFVIDYPDKTCSLVCQECTSGEISPPLPKAPHNRSELSPVELSNIQFHFGIWL